MTAELNDRAPLIDVIVIPTNLPAESDRQHLAITFPAVHLRNNAEFSVNTKIESQLLTLSEKLISAPSLHE